MPDASLALFKRLKEHFRTSSLCQTDQGTGTGGMSLAARAILIKGAVTQQVKIRSRNGPLPKLPALLKSMVRGLF